MLNLDIPAVVPVNPNIRSKLLMFVPNPRFEFHKTILSPPTAYDIPPTSKDTIMRFWDSKLNPKEGKPKTKGRSLLTKPGNVKNNERLKAKLGITHLQTPIN
jgi:hypothetical protein